MTSTDSKNTVEDETSSGSRRAIGSRVQNSNSIHANMALEATKGSTRHRYGYGYRLRVAIHAYIDTYMCVRNKAVIKIRFPYRYSIAELLSPKDKAASTNASLIWSATLSGCPEDTDSEVKVKLLVIPK